MSDKETDDRLPLVVDIAFHFGDFVSRKTDPDQNVGIVTGVILRASSTIYIVAWECIGEKEHYDYELRAAEEPGERA